MTNPTGLAGPRPKLSMAELLKVFAPYREARKLFLLKIGKHTSQRDPLAEFSEYFVAVLLKGSLANRRTQPGWDVELETGEHVQVRYLANLDRTRWVNEHLVDFRKPVDLYALVLLEAFYKPSTVLVFRRGQTKPIYDILKKRHSNPDDTLSITLANVKTFERKHEQFEALGMRIIPITRMGRES